LHGSKNFICFTSEPEGFHNSLVLGMESGLNTHSNQLCTMDMIATNHGVGHLFENDAVCIPGSKQANKPDMLYVSGSYLVPKHIEICPIRNSLSHKKRNHTLNTPNIVKMNIGSSLGRGDAAH
jgi:hypothetical protein